MEGGRFSTKATGMLVVWAALLLPFGASGQEVTDGRGISLKPVSNYTAFAGSEETGRLALLSGTKGNYDYYVLDPYNGASETTYGVSTRRLSLNFVLNHRADDPLQGRTFVGVEFLRLYTHSRIDDRVRLYRNEKWFDADGRELGRLAISGPSLAQFVKQHSVDQMNSPELVAWHAKSSEVGSSSWVRRDAISEGLGREKARSAYLPVEAVDFVPQGTYRLIGFKERKLADSQNPVRFDVRLHGTRRLLVNVFGPTDSQTHDVYGNQYSLEIVTN